MENAGDIGNPIMLGSGAELTQNANGTFSYDPNGAFESLKVAPGVPNEDTDTFDYTLIDSDGATDTATVTVTITGVNDPPLAQDDMFTTPQDTAIMMADVMANNGNGADQDPEGDTTTVTQVNGAGFVSGIAFALPSGAMLNIQTNGIFSYDPNTLTTPPPAGGSVNDSFTYQLCDPSVACDTATVTIQVDSSVAAVPPVAQNDSYASFFADTNQTIAAGAGLFVDNGSGADTLGTPAATLTSFGGGSLGGAVTDNAAGASVAFANGTLTVNADGSWSLTGQPFTAGTFHLRLSIDQCRWHFRCHRDT